MQSWENCGERKKRGCKCWMQWLVTLEKKTTIRQHRRAMKPVKLCSLHITSFHTLLVNVVLDWPMRLWREFTTSLLLQHPRTRFEICRPQSILDSVRFSSGNRMSNLFMMWSIRTSGSKRKELTRRITIARTDIRCFLAIYFDVEVGSCTFAASAARFPRSAWL